MLNTRMDLHAVDRDRSADQTPLQLYIAEVALWPPVDYQLPCSDRRKDLSGRVSASS